MRRAILLGAALAAILILALGATFPVKNGVLDSDLNGGGYSLTNLAGLTGSFAIAPTNVSGLAAFEAAGVTNAGNGLVRSGNTMHFATSSAYSINRIPYVTGTNTIGFDNALRWDPSSVAFQVHNGGFGPAANLRASGDVTFTGSGYFGSSSGLSTAGASAALQIDSIIKGLLIPRMTTAQRDAISSPATGLLVFDTDTGEFEFYTGSAWTGVVATNVTEMTVNNFTTTNVTVIQSIKVNGKNLYSVQAADSSIGITTNGTSEIDLSATNITEAKLLLSDNTTADATTSKHGLLPKPDGNSSHVLLGTGAYGAVPGSGSGSVVYLNGTSVTSPDFVDSSTAIWDVLSSTNVHVYPTNLANAQISASAAIAKSKISSSGTWAASDLPTIQSTADGGSSAVKLKNYIVLAAPHSCDGTGAIIYTNDNTQKYFGQAAFSGSAAATGNYVEYRITVPEDIDTSVDLKVERLKIRLGAADTSGHSYVISMASVADSASFDSPTLGQSVTLTLSGDASGASGDVETISNVTLTSWKSNVTAGQLWVIRLARNGDTDASTQTSYSGPLVISYGSTQ